MFSYTHESIGGNKINRSVGKVVCVGRNYMQHIQELNNEVPEQPLLFIKPSTALCKLAEPVFIPDDLGACHNELEIAVLIDKPLTKVLPEQVKSAIWGIGLGLDLTLRDVQTQLKNKGQPWERAKAFDLSCPMSGFVPLADSAEFDQLKFSLMVDGELRQQGDSADMMLSIIELLVEISHSFSLLPGDIVMTGTPKGVGPLTKGQSLKIALENGFSISTKTI